MTGNSRFDHLRAPKGNRKSSPGDNRLGYSRVTESVDERVLSSASTPINNGPYGAKSSLAMSRHSVPDMAHGNELASALPRRFSNNGAASASPGNARPSRLAGTWTPTRDENEAPSNGVPLAPPHPFPPPPPSASRDACARCSVGAQCTALGTALNPRTTLQPPHPISGGGVTQPSLMCHFGTFGAVEKICLRQRKCPSKESNCSKSNHVQNQKDCFDILETRPH